MDESQPATDQETTTADLPAAANQTATFKIGDRVGISTAAGRPCTDGTGYFAGTIIRIAEPPHEFEVVYDLYRDSYYSNVSSSQLLTWAQYTNILEIQQLARADSTVVS